MKLALPISLLLAATPALAGGPVIVAEETPMVSPHTEDGRVPRWVIPVTVAVIALALIAGSDACNSEPEPPVGPPGAGGC